MDFGGWSVVASCLSPDDSARAPMRGGAANSMSEAKFAIAPAPHSLATFSDFD
jgi:hypothetical protein